MQRKLLSLLEILKIKSLTAAPEKIKQFGILGNQFLFVELKMNWKNTKTLFILIFCPLGIFILSGFVPQDKHTVFNALKNILTSTKRKNREPTDAEIISDHQDLQTTICPTVTVTQEQRQNESEEIERETCKSYDQYFFLLGKSEEPLENYPDYVVGDFLDTYENLILKTKTAYEYFEQYCKEANNFMLIDDDVVFNFGAIMNILRKEEAQNIIYGKRLDQQDGKVIF
jgi:hypothetical protein